MTTIPILLYCALINPLLQLYIDIQINIDISYLVLEEKKLPQNIEMFINIFQLVSEEEKLPQNIDFD